MGTGEYNAAGVAPNPGGGGKVEVFQVTSCYRNQISPGCMVHWHDADFNLTYVTRTELNTRRSDKPVGFPNQKGRRDLGELSSQSSLPSSLQSCEPGTRQNFIFVQNKEFCFLTVFSLFRRNTGGINQRNVNIFENEAFISLQAIRLVGMDGMQSKTLASDSTTKKRPGMKHNPCAGQRKRL